MGTISRLSLGIAFGVLAFLVNATRKELILLDGGSGAGGNPCEAMHHHGFIGQEKEAVTRITSWIRAAY